MSLPNYGFTLRAAQPVNLVAARAKLTFIIDLPEKPVRQANLTFNCTHGDQNWHKFENGRLVKCDQITASFHFLFQTQATLLNELSKLIDSIHNSLKSFDNDDKRMKRAWLPFIGNFLHTVAGVSTDEQTEELRQTIRKLEGINLAQSQMWKDGSSSFIHATKLNSDRIRNLAAMVEEHTSSIHSLYTALSKEYQNMQYIGQILVNEQNHLATAMFLLSDVESFRLAIDQLLSGKLPSYLVPYESLHRALNNLNDHLQDNNDYHIVHKNVHFYYLHGHFGVTRKNNKLVIALECPLSHLQQPLILYELTKFPLEVYNNEGYYSILAVNFHGILYNNEDDIYAIVNSASDIPDSATWDVTNHNLQLFTKTILSCALSLITLNESAIHHLCTYEIIAGQMQPQVFFLGNGHFLLSNITEISKRCRYRSNSSSFTETKRLIALTSIIQLHCGCSAMADIIYIPEIAHDCPSLTNIKVNWSIKNTLNLNLLKLYFSSDELKYFRGDTLVDNLSISLPNLTIATSHFQTLLAFEENARFDMKRLVNHTLADQQAYSSLSHFIASKLTDNVVSMQSSFNILDFRSWLLISACSTSVVALLSVFVLNHRIRALTLIAAMSRPTLSHSLPTLLEYRRATPATPFSSTASTPYLHNQMFSDITLAVASIIIICLLIYIVHRLRKVMPTTTVMLTIGDNSSHFSMPWCQLDHAPMYYSFNTDSVSVQLMLQKRYLFFTYLILQCEGLLATHTELEHPIGLPRCHRLSLQQARILRVLLQNEPKLFVALYLRNINHKNCQLIVLRKST